MNASIDLPYLGSILIIGVYRFHSAESFDAADNPFFTIGVDQRDSTRAGHLLAEDGVLAVETLAGTIGEETRTKADVIAMT